MIGKIKVIRTERNYAFLIQRNGKDLFFHLSEVQDFAELKVGQMVTYTDGFFNGKPVATKVYVLSEGTDTSAPVIGATNEKN